MGVMAVKPAVGMLLGVLFLSGCLSTGAKGPDTVDAITPALAQIEATAQSATIGKLLNRQSVIQPGSPFDAVAKSVLATNARTAEADLRAARLRSRAAEKNWLPRIGPNISLSSMGDLVAQLLIEQVVFDNGRKKAERAYAAADVEASAVLLAQDTNDRVAQALQLHIKSARARNEAQVAQTALDRMGKFANIIERRVNGGVSNMADLRVAQAKLNELTADYNRAREEELTASAELEAMAGMSASGVSGISGLNSQSAQGRNPLNVLLAQAEGSRAVSKAKIDRASNLPGIKISGSAGEGGDVAVGVAGDNLIGFGIGDTLAAIQASEDAANRSVQQAAEDNQRIVNRLHQRRLSLQRQQAESAALVADGQTTYKLFFNQFQNSGRPIMDVVNIYENAMRLERDAVRLKYELAEIEVEIANLYGTLVSGDDV